MDREPYLTKARHPTSRGTVKNSHTGQPHQSAAVPRIKLLLRPVVVHERDGIGQRRAGLPLSPIDDLDDTGAPVMS